MNPSELSSTYQASGSTVVDVHAGQSASSAELASSSTPLGEHEVAAVDARAEEGRDGLLGSQQRCRTSLHVSRPAFHNTHSRAFVQKSLQKGLGGCLVWLDGLLRADRDGHPAVERRPAAADRCLGGARLAAAVRAERGARAAESRPARDRRRLPRARDARDRHHERPRRERRDEAAGARSTGRARAGPPDLVGDDDRRAAALPARGRPSPAPDRRPGGRAGQEDRGRRPARRSSA